MSKLHTNLYDGFHYCKEKQHNKFQKRIKMQYHNEKEVENFLLTYDMKCKIQYKLFLIINGIINTNKISV